MDSRTPPMTRVLVCGGRSYGEVARLDAVLDRLHAERKFSVLICGGATGADSLAMRWAAIRGVPTEVHYADWANEGKAAGPIRNKKMLVEGKPNLVVAFPGGVGTSNMVGIAREAGIEVLFSEDDLQGNVTHFRNTHAFLSNFHPCPVVLDGVTYPSVEHAYVAAKTTNPSERAHIATLATPAAAKKAGRSLRPRDNWSEIRVGIMRDLLQQKFAQEPFKALLLSTGKAAIVEGNDWHDIFWGRCNCPTHRGMGENILGKLIEEIRASIRV